MKEALQLELPFTEVPSMNELLSDSVRLAKDELKTQFSIVKSQIVLATNGTTIIAVKTAMFVGNAVAAPFRVVAMIGLFMLMALSSVVKMTANWVANAVRNPILATRRFLRIAAMTVSSFALGTIMLYAAILLPLYIDIIALIVLSAMMSELWSMFRTSKV